jgi:hypothetical protein
MRVMHIKTQSGTALCGTSIGKVIDIDLPSAESFNACTHCISIWRFQPRYGYGAIYDGALPNTD